MDLTFNYLTDPRDRALLAATPTLMAPRFGRLPPVEVGQHRFVVGANGLFVQARTKAMDVTLRIASTPMLPYGALQENVSLAGGPLPYRLYREMVERACRASPTEWAGVVVYDGREYRLIEPVLDEASLGSITYRTSAYDDEAVALDIHSHGRGDSFFSETDNQSDTGIYLAAVLGRCHSPESVTVKVRVVVRGIFYAVAWVPWYTQE